MDYEVLSEMLPLGRQGEMVLGLQTTRDLMEVLGNPQEKVPTIHVAGTNGKGSTSKIMATILQEAGYKVGLYTSPSLYEFNDRIRINNENISDEDIMEFAVDIRDHVLSTDIYFTEFELYTALAWMAFAKYEVDVAVIETGIGGRLDATNIIQSPLVSVITKLAYDHQDVLGDTIEEIAGEKAGIIKPGSPVVYYPSEKAAVDVIAARAEELGSSKRTVDLDALKYELNNNRTQDFVYKGEEYTIQLLEAHQIYNSCVAIEVMNTLNDLEDWSISKDALKAGLEKTVWEARFEWVQENPDIMIDGSHNLDGVTGLTENLLRYFPGQQRIGIVGMLGDKEFKPALSVIAPHFDFILTVQPDSERALSADDMKQTILDMGVLSEEKVISLGKDYKKALEIAVEKTETDMEGAVICVFGSFYYVGEVRQLILQSKG